jgi:hypothetical protein
MRLSWADFFAALGWHQQSTGISADAADFWGADGTQAAERWVAPSGACEVVLLPIANTAPVLRPVDCAVTTPGGLFDINMRTWDSEWARDFFAHAWLAGVGPGSCLAIWRGAHE